MVYRSISASTTINDTITQSQRQDMKNVLVGSLSVSFAWRNFHIMSCFLHYKYQSIEYSTRKLSIRVQTSINQLDYCLIWLWFVSTSFDQGSSKDLWARLLRTLQLEFDLALVSFNIQVFYITISPFTPSICFEPSDLSLFPQFRISIVDLLLLEGSGRERERE